MNKEERKRRMDLYLAEDRGESRGYSKGYKDAAEYATEFARRHIFNYLVKKSKSVFFDEQGFSTALKRALEHELDYKKRYGR